MDKGKSHMREGSRVPVPVNRISGRRGGNVRTRYQGRRQNSEERSRHQMGTAAEKTTHSTGERRLDLSSNTRKGDENENHSDIHLSEDGAGDRRTPAVGLPMVTDEDTFPPPEYESPNDLERLPKKRDIAYRSEEDEEKVDWGDDYSQVDASEFPKTPSTPAHRPVDLGPEHAVVDSATRLRRDDECSEGSIDDG